MENANACPFEGHMYGNVLNDEEAMQPTIHIMLQPRFCTPPLLN